MTFQGVPGKKSKKTMSTWAEEMRSKWKENTEKDGENMTNQHTNCFPQFTEDKTLKNNVI